jgi:hypothetical protein
MATQLPLNVFRTRPVELTTATQDIYTSPSGYTAIVLGAQASNISTQTVKITFTMTKNAVDYILLKEFEIPKNDAIETTSGKLVLEEGCIVKASVSRNNSVIFVLSLLETSNV